MTDGINYDGIPDDRAGNAGCSHATLKELPYKEPSNNNIYSIFLPRISRYRLYHIVFIMTNIRVLARGSFRIGLEQNDIVPCRHTRMHMKVARQ